MKVPELQLKYNFGKASSFAQYPKESDWHNNKLNVSNEGVQVFFKLNQS